MQCPTCQHENPTGAKFCMECGAKLENACPKCGTKLPAEAKFCMECGTKIGEESTPPAVQQVERSEIPRSGDVDSVVSTPADEPSAPEAERRQLTVMFCDLVGSTALSAQLDPEELREVVRNYQSVCTKVIARFEGHIAQYLGDGLLVYFGYPHAHEDNAQRATRAGLGIVGAIEQVNVQLSGDPGITLAVRIGIHTGLVVVGEMGEGDRRQQLALGETPNIAARLEGVAQPNTLVISAATYRLIEGFFECQALGPHALKGISEPMEVYQVLYESTARTRLDVAETTGLTPLVGRTQEVGLLMECWEQVKVGRGQVVLLNGEAGIGKSRLVQVVKEHVAQESGAWMTECRCSPYHQNSALYPVIDVLERAALSFEREDAPAEKLTKLEGYLVQHGFSLEETVPLFATLLSLPLDPSYAPLSLSPELRKHKTLDALLRILLLRAQQQPLLLWLTICIGPTRPRWNCSTSLLTRGRRLGCLPSSPFVRIFACRGRYARTLTISRSTTCPTNGRKKWLNRSPVARRCRPKCLNKLFKRRRVCPFLLKS